MPASCRLCMRSGAINNIFAREGLLKSKIVLCCRLEPEINDGLPAVICKSCQDNLNRFWNFQIECHESDTKLRAMLAPSLNSINAPIEIPIKIEIETEPDIYSDDNTMENDGIDFEDVKIEPQSSEELSKNTEIVLGDVGIKPARKSRGHAKYKDCSVCDSRIAVYRMAAHLKTHVKLSESNKNGSDDVEPSKSQYKCSHCSKAFEFKSQVDKHIILQHLSSKGCPICGRNICAGNMTRHLDRHKRTKHGRLPLDKYALNCDYCSKVFDRKARLEVHIMRMHLQTERCKVCNEGVAPFKLAGHLKNHRIEERKRRVEERRSGIKTPVKKLIITDREIYECDYCSKTLKKKSRLEAHIKTNHLYSGKCSICSRMISLANLSRHLKYHKRQGLKRRKNLGYDCPVCALSFAQILSLMRHLGAKHSNRHDLECPACNLKVPGSEMIEHTMTHKELLKSCLLCNMNFTESADLKKHMQTHVIQGPDGPRFACGHCDVSIRNLKGLRMHITQMHKSPYRRKCDVCHRYLSSKFSFLNHMKLHATAEYECDYCQQRFFRKSSLKYHIMNHLNYRPHRCRWCSQKFTSRAYLRGHEMLHTGEKPFLCSVCGKTFNHRGNMKSHMRHNHKELGKA